MLARDGTADFEEFVSMNATINGVKMSTRMIPAQNAASGGDWCEAIVLSENVIALSICGHGAESFHTMVATRAAIRESLHRHANPAHALADASRFLRGYDAATYATALVALLDIESGRILFANAGHPPPLMTGLHGTDFLEFSDFDLPIGLVDECEPTLRIVHLPADSLRGATPRGGTIRISSLRTRQRRGYRATDVFDGFEPRRRRDPHRANSRGHPPPVIHDIGLAVFALP
jgi:hypothetical protein